MDIFTSGIMAYKMLFYVLSHVMQGLTLTETARLNPSKQKPQGVNVMAAHERELGLNCLVVQLCHI